VSIHAVRVAMLLHKSVVSDSRVRREAAALARAGHDVVVLELAAVAEPRLDGFRRRSVLPPAWLRRHLPFHLYRVAFLAWFVAGIVRERPDAVHAHDAAMLLPGIAGARLSGARVGGTRVDGTRLGLVYDSHELATSVPYRERLWALFVARIERLVVPRCAAVITVSEGIAGRLQTRYRLARRPTVVRNVSALEPGGLGGLRARLGIDADTPLVLHQGAPAQARGCEVLVRALAQLPDVHLAFLGDPERAYARELRHTIAAHGLDERVRLLPGVPLGELLAHTAEADVGVTLLQDTCLNHRLALPNKLFEYIAAGVPVVAAALPEILRLVEEYGVGWCVAPDDASAVAGALRAALDGARDASLRERLAHAAQELSWEREQLRLLELYEDLSAAENDHPVAAQQRHAHERAVAAAGTARERGKERQRATPHQREIPAPATPSVPAPAAASAPAYAPAAAEPRAQLRQADAARVGVRRPDTRLPDRDGAAGFQHAAHLLEHVAHGGARSDGR
jgi:glycosyltransferase involved in cell wall biosynthesis